jgi:hypothetical protein
MPFLPHLLFYLFSRHSSWPNQTQHSTSITNWWTSTSQAFKQTSFPPPSPPLFPFPLGTISKRSFSFPLASSVDHIDYTLHRHPTKGANHFCFEQSLILSAQRGRGVCFPFAPSFLLFYFLCPCMSALLLLLSFCPRSLPASQPEKTNLDWDY